MVGIVDYAHGGNFSKVRDCIEQGEDPNTVGDFGNTPLMLASKNGYLTISKYLVSKGADVHARNSHGDTALGWASYGGHLDVAEYLISKGVYVDNLDNNRFTPLMSAAYWGRMNVIKFLISKGANIKLWNIRGNTAMDRAHDGRNLDIVQYLGSLKGVHSLQHIVLNKIEKEGISRGGLPEVLFMR